jgi:excisionase family DNA binding protein
MLEIGQHVFTVAEVANALRVSAETVRRKIESGELQAIEFSKGQRKQYRVLLSHLEQWLGQAQAQAVFVQGDIFEQISQLFADLTDSERDQLAADATAWAKTQRSEQPLTGKTVSAEDIAMRFGKKP